MAMSLTRFESIYDNDERIITEAAVPALVAEAHPPPPLLWHYCSPSTLISIVENKCIWASDIFYMNDAQEVHYGVALIIDCLEKLLAKPSLDETTRSVIQRNLKKFEAKIDKTKIYTTRRFFCLSLSEDGDDLNLWRGYSDRGLGFSLGLDLSGIRTEPLQGVTLDLKPIIYDEDEQRRLIKKIVDTHRDFITRNKTLLQSNAGLVNAFSGWMYSALVEAIFFMKNPAFAGEREWRLLYWYVKAEVRRRPPKVHFRANEKTVIPYVRIGAGDLVKGAKVLPIKKLATGPQIETKLSRLAIFELLRANGYEIPPITIKPSGVPFRAL